MAEYLSPGVYIEEFEIGAKPIEGVSTSTAGFLGETERGPTVPTLVTSWLEYQRIFGGYFGEDKYLPYAVQGFFENGGSRCFIGRIVKAGDAPATTAQATLTHDNTNALTVEAVGEGSSGNQIAVEVSKGTMKGFKLTAFYWKTPPSVMYNPLIDTTTTPRPSIIEVFDDIEVSSTSSSWYEKKINGISNLIRLKKNTGDSGEMPETGISGDVAAGSTTNTIKLVDSSSNIDAYNGLQIEITDGKGKGQVSIISDYDGATKTATVSPDWTIIPDNTSKYHISQFCALTGGDSFNEGVALAGATGTTIPLAATASTTDQVYKSAKIEIVSGVGKGQVRTISNYVGATKTATVSPDWITNPDATSSYRITPVITRTDFERTDTNNPGERKGLSGFEEVDEIAIVYAPDAHAVTGLEQSLITHCEQLKDRFAILDSESGLSSVASIKPRSDITDTRFAAYYYPWITVIHPTSGTPYDIPPGGHVAGIYARSDTERGVHKAPANEIVRGATDLEFQITKGEQDILNPRGVNVIRAFPGRGIRIWGARTLSSDALWKYINVRRLFNYIEESVDEGTQWVVFEPNNEKLWARVRATITQFLTRVWHDGALMGTKAEEAFFVKCDRTTMTQDDIDNGRLVCIIGIAPVKPAEFVIFRIAQWQGGSAVTE
jgi:uncharacterized protein